jgi:hypothetical protein
MERSILFRVLPRYCRLKIGLRCMATVVTVITYADNIYAQTSKSQIEQTSTTDPSVQDNKNATYTTTLDVLSFTKGELYDLLFMHHGRGGEKLVFHLLRLGNGELTLLAWSGKKNSSDFDPASVVRLQPVSPEVSISGKDIALANMEPNQQTLSKLISYARGSGAPTLKVMLVPVIIDQGNFYELNYQIKVERMLLKDNVQSLTLELLGLANPAPPHPGN